MTELVGRRRSLVRSGQCYAELALVHRIDASAAKFAEQLGLPPPRSVAAAHTPHHGQSERRLFAGYDALGLGPPPSGSAPAPGALGGARLWVVEPPEAFVLAVAHGLVEHALAYRRPIEVLFPDRVVERAFIDLAGRGWQALQGDAPWLAVVVRAERFVEAPSPRAPRVVLVGRCPAGPVCGEASHDLVRGCDASWRLFSQLRLTEPVWVPELDDHYSPSQQRVLAALRGGAGVSTAVVRLDGASWAAAVRDPAKAHHLFLSANPQPAAQGRSATGFVVGDRVRCPSTGEVSRIAKVIAYDSATGAREPGRVHIPFSARKRRRDDSTPGAKDLYALQSADFDHQICCGSSDVRTRASFAVHPLELWAVDRFDPRRLDPGPVQGAADVHLQLTPGVRRADVLRAAELATQAFCVYGTPAELAAALEH